MRYASYTNNTLNQYTSRTVPGYVNVLGTATNTATVSLWSKDSTVLYTSTTRKGDYFRGEMPFNNATGALWLTITNVAVLSNSASADIVTNIGGSSLLAKTPEAFLYDADGNLTNDSLWAYTWDAENRLVRQESVNSLPTAGKRRLDFAYDHQSRRIQKLVSTHNGSSYVAQSTNRFIYDGWNLLAALSPQAAVIQSFMWGLDLSGSEQGAGGVGGLLAVTDTAAINNQPSTHFAGYDGNGNVAVLVAAASGTISAKYEYGPFSEGVRLTGPMAKANKFRFSTKYQDDESDQLYYGYRSYNPSSGRWLSRDPIEERGGLNLYDFSSNSGIGYFDYLGLKLNCSCANSPVNITLAAADKGFDSDLRIAEVGQGTVAALESSIGLKINSPAKECIQSLTLIAHGNPDTINLENDKTSIPANQPLGQASSISPYNVSAVFGRIAKGFCFCKPCAINILSCNVGLGSIPQMIAEATGCTVYAANGFCHPNAKDPLNSKVEPTLPDPWVPGHAPYKGAGSNMVPFEPTGKIPMVPSPK